jgi:hypothetical protein
VRRLEHLDAGHHPLGEEGRRRHVRQRLELRRHRARLLELGPALGAASHVRPQGRHAEAHLAVEEKVDLVWK